MITYNIYPESHEILDDLSIQQLREIITDELSDSSSTLHQRMEDFIEANYEPVEKCVDEMAITKAHFEDSMTGTGLEFLSPNWKPEKVTYNGVENEFKWSNY